jgi:glycosyltransferase involved in cell wall biosynthesis
MRVVYLNADRGIPALGQKGASVHVRAFVAALAVLGHEVTLLCSRLGSGNPPPPVRLIEIPPVADEAALAEECWRLDLEYAALTDTILRAEIARLANDRTLAIRAAASLATEGVVPDLIYERHALFHCAGIALGATTGVARVLEVNAPLVEEQARFRNLRLRAEAQAREDRSFRAADLVVAVSGEVRDHVLSRGVAESRVMVLPNGVDTASFAPAATRSAGAAIRQRLGLGDSPVIGFIGGFRPWHGMDFLLEAFARLGAAYATTKLLAVGTGPMLEAARARAAEAGVAGRVIFTGEIPHAEVPGHLAAMDFTVAPYLPRDDFYFSPLKVVESLAAGRAVVAPRIGQIESLIRHGETGLLYPPGNLATCTALLTVMLEDESLRTRMGARASALACRDCDWTQLADRVLAHPALAASSVRRKPPSVVALVEQ